jgi:hypothetical protein
VRGRKPKPLQQQIAEGDPRQRGKWKLRDRLQAEPKAARGLPPCPERLTGVARQRWGAVERGAGGHETGLQAR